jgi:ABC-type phosphate/phosphonate transport system substrate-binding protein
MSRLCRLLPLCALLVATPVPADLVLSSAPRDTREAEEQIYKPIAELLTKVTGEKVTFKWGDNFLIYQSEMRKGIYDITLDGPHLVAWRMAKLGHVPVVKFPGSLEFVLIVKKDQNKVQTLKDMAGRTVCALPPPNLATLTVLSEFDNPSRQPHVIGVQAFGDTYKGVVSGQCVGGILQAKLYFNLDKDAKAAKVVFDTKPLPNQAFTVGPRVTAETRDKMAQALLSPEGAAASQKLLDAFKAPKLVSASPDEYRGLERLVRNEFGFE